MNKKHPGGRPQKYDFETLEASLNGILKAEGKKTVKALAIALGISRQTVYDMIGRGEEWKKLIYSAVEKRGETENTE